MASDARLFEAQKAEFDASIAMYNEKLTRMYLKEAEISFDDRIHEVWDGWDLAKRCEFIESAFRQVNLQSNKEKILLAKTCPEVIDAKLIARENKGISQFLHAIAVGQENAPTYPWYDLVMENIRGMLGDLNYDLWKTFTDKKTKRIHTTALMLCQRSMYINQVAVYLIANFCGEFSGNGPLAKTVVKCAHCSTPTTSKKRCSRCKKVHYCSKECQINHWPCHRGVCK